MRLHGLGYIGLTAPDPAAWLEFGTDVVGLMPARMFPGETSAIPGVAPDGSVYLKMDDRQWRIAIHPGDTGGVAYLGFQVAHESALVEAMAAIAAHGTPINAGTPEEAASRAVAGLAWCIDPAGNRVELFYGPAHDRGFVSPHGVEFVTGELGLGHALLFVADIDASLTFYRDVLGFQRTDFILPGPGTSVHFLRCTPRHHSIGLAHMGPFDAMHHLMVETTSLDAVGAALDRAQDAGAAITKTLGRHMNDQMVSFYMRSPAGFEVEVGFDGLLVDDDWCDREAAGGEPWGHKGVNIPAQT